MKWPSNSFCVLAKFQWRWLTLHYLKSLVISIWYALTRFFSVYFCGGWNHPCMQRVERSVKVEVGSIIRLFHLYFLFVLLGFLSFLLFWGFVLFFCTAQYSWKSSWSKLGLQHNSRRKIKILNKLWHPASKLENVTITPSQISGKCLFCFSGSYSFII